MSFIFKQFGFKGKIKFQASFESDSFQLLQLSVIN